MTHRFARAMTVLSGAGLAIALAASPAAAQRVEGGPYHEEFTGRLHGLLRRAPA